MRTKPGILPHFAVSSLLSVLTLAGCAGTPQQVTTLARQDLACPSADVAELDPERYAASGCGRGAVYVRICDDAGCRWGRLRHGHETAIAGQTAAALSPAASEAQPTEPREVLAAPPPEAREVVPAPPPAPREIIAAPPPDAAPDQSDAGVPTPAPPQAAPPATEAPVPLSQGELSEPYEASVPARPEPQRTAYAPPQPLVDDRPPPPAPGYQWVGGYWFWGVAGWVWLPGYWCAPVMGYAYAPGYWYWSMNYWWYWPGGWARPGSTVIVYQPPPRSQRIVRVRSFTARSTAGHSASMAPSPAARATSRSGFRPEGSPLLRYPTAVRATPRGSRATTAGSGIGRVVTPGSRPARPTHFASPRPVQKSAGSAGSTRWPSGSAGSSRGSVGPQPARPLRSAPAHRAPSVGRAQRR